MPPPMISAKGTETATSARVFMLSGQYPDASTKPRPTTAISAIRTPPSIQASAVVAQMTSGQGVWLST